MAPASQCLSNDPSRTSPEVTDRDGGTPGRRAVRRSGGFTLVELLVVVVMLGILAGIANNMLDSRKSGYIAALQADMRTLAAAQEEYFLENYTYAQSVSHLDVSIRPEVQVTMVVTGEGWSMRVRHKDMLQFYCAMFSGRSDHSFPPATRAGVMECVPKVKGMGKGGGANGSP